MLAGIKFVNSCLTVSSIITPPSLISSFFQYNLFPLILFDSVHSILNYYNTTKNKQTYESENYNCVANIDNDTCILNMTGEAYEYNKKQWLLYFCFSIDIIKNYSAPSIGYTKIQKINFLDKTIENCVYDSEDYKSGEAKEYNFSENIIINNAISIIKNSDHFYFRGYRTCLTDITGYQIRDIKISPDGQDIIYTTNGSVHHVPITCFEDYSSKELLIERLKYKIKKVIFITLKIVLFFWYTLFYLKNLCSIDFKKTRDNYSARQKILEYLHGKIIFNLLFRLKQKEFLLNNYTLIPLIPIYRIFMK
jgi:hypothetical protein